jgi:hypothetical protein
MVRAPIFTIPTARWWSLSISRATPAISRKEWRTIFAARCFYDLNPQTELAMSWHVEVIAAKLAAVRQGKIRRLIINLLAI